MTQLAKQDKSNETDKSEVGRHKGLSLAEMIEYRSKGLTYQEIGDLVGCAKQTVHERLEPYREELDGLDVFKDRKGEVIQLAQNMLLSSLTPSKIKDMSAYQAVGSFGILYDKGRLEEGKSTSNLSLAVTANRLSEGLEGLREELSNLPVLEDEGE